MSKRRSNYGAFAGSAQVGSKLGLRHDSESGGDVFEQICQAQSDQGAVSQASIEQIALQTGTCEARVRGVGSFYSLVDFESRPDNALPVVRICDGPTCCLRGAKDLRMEASKSTSSYRVERTSCLGYCDLAPVMLVDRSRGQRSIVANAVWQQDPARLQDADAITVPLLERSPRDATRLPLTKRFGIDPCSIDEALSNGAYLALQQTLEMDAHEVIHRVSSSGLRGRGGAGFNTGQKWQIAAQTPADQRYVICNADESEPGTFKDRLLMERDPHAVLEGMAICARAIGANQGVIYIRAEYQKAYEILQHAVVQARERGFLGDDIFDREFAFDVSIHQGAGAYICGEESALLESLEGKRGEPRERPPFPATHGYWGKPTVVNNVETLCSVPSIIREGADAYRDLGYGDACGTKLFCLSGDVERPGVCEAPMGTTIGQLITEFGGGPCNGIPTRFALTGGAAGTFVPPAHFGVPLTYDAMSEGVVLGSGAIIVANQTDRPVDMLLWVLDFFVHESCGKCTPCRIGCVQARDIVQRIALGQQQRDDVTKLSNIAKTLGSMSLCGLGASVAWPIESVIKHFRDDLDATTDSK